MNTDVLVAALAAERAGISVVPPAEDSSKRPLGGWKQYQSQRATPEEIRNWYAPGRTGLGFVCGRISGNLELIEFEVMAVFERYDALAQATGLGGVLDSLKTGYFEATPGGGVHLLTRCTEIAGNAKLARRPGPPDECGKPTVEVLIETRGEGGYVVVAPTFGKVHPTGKHYVQLRGGAETIATITPNERRALWELARTFDEMPKLQCSEPENHINSSRCGGDRPGDDFNQRAGWAQVLEPHGWRKVFEKGETTYWRRPGKDLGISATTGHGGYDLLYVFTTSTIFDADSGYSKFRVFAILDHGGDFRAAAKALAARGYGANEAPNSLAITKRPIVRPHGAPLPALQRPRGVPASAFLQGVPA